MAIHFGVTVSAAPAEEPVSLESAKEHLRVTHDDEAALIQALVIAAREHVEDATGRALVTRTYQMKLDGFPDDDTEPIPLPYPPLQSVTSITYVDGAGTTQTWDAVNYIVDAASVPGRIVPAYGQHWPSPRDQKNAVTITYVAGYGGGHEVPEALKAAMKLLVGDWYLNREAQVTGTIISENRAVDALLRSYRLVSVD